MIQSIQHRPVACVLCIFLSADLSYPVLLQSYLSQLDDVVGTFAYAAPELLLGVRCTERVDCYAFGVLVWEIATGERPQRGQLRDVRYAAILPKFAQRDPSSC